MGVVDGIGLAGGVCPTGGLFTAADGGTNSLAFGFSTNSFANGLSLDLETLIVLGEDVVEAAAEVVAAAGVTVVSGGVLAGVGVLCSVLSCLEIIEAVGGDCRLAGS